MATTAKQARRNYLSDDIAKRCVQTGCRNPAAAGRVYCDACGLRRAATIRARRSGLVVASDTAPVRPGQVELPPQREEQEIEDLRTDEELWQEMGDRRTATVATIGKLQAAVDARRRAE